MRGETRVEFEFPIRFSENGSFVETTFITLRAPGLGKRDVHQTMHAYVMEAVASLQRRRATLIAEADDGSAPPKDDDDGEQEAKPEDPDQEAMGLWQTMSMGLGPERFVTFSEYVMKRLTNTPKLATIGENGMPLTDEVWQAIDDKGGMAEVDRVMARFTRFFFESPRSRKKSGANSSASSSSPTKAASPINMPRSSRSKS